MKGHIDVDIVKKFEAHFTTLFFSFLFLYFIFAPAESCQRIHGRSGVIAAEV